MGRKHAATGRRRSRDMTLDELALFAAPVLLSDVGRATGMSAEAWCRLIVRAHVAGLVESPGASPRWHLTDAGRRAVFGTPVR